jgi:signal transduction histidine kinase
MRPFITRSTKQQQTIAPSRSSSITLAILFTLLLSVSLLTLLFFMQLASKRTVQGELENFILNEINVWQHIAEHVGIDTTLAIAERSLDKTTDHRYVIIDKQGTAVSTNISQLPDTLLKMLKHDSIINYTLQCRDGKIAEYVFVKRPLSSHYSLILGKKNMTSGNDKRLITMLGWGVSLLLFLLAIGGFFVADRVVYRINIIADTANDIVRTGDLSRRIPYFGSWDDLSKLADILNQLFARVEYLMDEVRHTSDMIAHDLRTPLTRLKNRLEMLRDKSEDEQLGIEEEAELLIDEADHLLATFAALLRIRTIESGKWRTQGEAIALDALIHDVVDYYEPLISEKEQHITLQLQPVSFKGDRHLLFQAMANMIDNAVKYAPSHSTISVTLSHTSPTIHLTIHNSGSFITEEQLEKIFQRFYRTDNARTSYQGNGLGLSVVKAIVKLHHGDIIASSDENGFSLNITFNEN